MSVKTEIEYLESKIEKLQNKISAIQSRCEHDKIIYEYDSNTGNYDPSSDHYWVDIECLCCKARMTVYSDESPDLYRLKGVGNKFKTSKNEYKVLVKNGVQV